MSGSLPTLAKIDRDDLMLHSSKWCDATGGGGGGGDGGGGGGGNGGDPGRGGRPEIKMRNLESVQLR